MHRLLRGVGVAFLLLASATAAFALDQSAIEETNCLMACDANQQNCHAPGSASHRLDLSRAQYSPRQIARISAATSAHSKEGRR